MTTTRSFKVKLTIFLCIIFSFIIIAYNKKYSSPPENVINNIIYSPPENIINNINSSSLENVINNIDSTLSLTSCKHVSVDELDEWFHSKQWNEIPKIIHQTWKNKTLRKRQAQWSETWCKQYIGWRYHLWTDDENEVFVRTKFPWFYPTYKRLSPVILRVDSVRYLYMLYYGGLYMDLDYESIRRVDELFVNKHVVFGLLNYSFRSMNSVPNSWMVSRPNHPLWTYILYRIIVVWSRTTAKERNGFWNGKAEFFTGPHALFEGLMFYLHTNLHTDKSLNELFGDKESQTSHAIFEVANITFLGPKLINAFDWMNGVGGRVCSAERAGFNATECHKIVKPVYAITYWSHSYGHGHQNDSNYMENIKPK